LNNFKRASFIAALLQNRIGASAPYDFEARNLTAYGGLLAVATMLAYNLNCWLHLFHRQEKATVETMKHATLATARRRRVARGPDGCAPVLSTPLCA
jgi:hypothetical protein